MNIFFITNNKQFLGLGLLLVITLSYSCVSEIDYKTTRKASSVSDLVLKNTAASVQKTLSLFDKCLEEYQDGLFLKNWTYDPVTNNITFGKNEDQEARKAAINHKLGLRFADYIAKENKKTLKYQAPTLDAYTPNPFKKKIKLL